ncbi:DUF3025 domain-containing protein [Roseateles sp.]|uniref:DUF3025 domain-containing protein n=1 Tax=Roseateles sp. TaxID=1971397 RepID=UPI0037CA1E6F
MFAPNWRAPWLAPYCEAGQRVQARCAAGVSVAQALNEELRRLPIELSTGGLHFVSQQALPPSEAYEAFVARTGSVPTRDNAHDFFNGLVWLRQPLLKARLNAWHGQGLEGGGEGRRGALRDALTLLDENGALLQAPPALAQALVARDWPRLFIELRPLWQHARLELVGHALLEKLLQPRKPICAHVLLVESLEAAAAALDVDELAAKPFHPLPVLGVPGWWAGNAEADFYADEHVFRPRRSRLQQTG